MSELILDDGENSDDDTVIMDEGNEETNASLLDNITGHFQNNVFVNPILSTSTERGRGKGRHFVFW